jgi:DNA adenine methylase
VHSTRSISTRTSGYKHELTDEQHRALAQQLAALHGKVVVSGYRCELYDELFARWRRIDAAAHADGARGRVESLWFSPNCHALLDLFD